MYGTEERSIAGKTARKHGQNFEVSVRHDLTAKGWIVFKNDNKLRNGVFAQAPKFYQKFRGMMMSCSGFPDFICINPKEDHIFIECKKNKYLNQEEKFMVAWLKENIKIPISIAFKNKQGEIEYKDA